MLIAPKILLLLSISFITCCYSLMSNSQNINPCGNNTSWKSQHDFDGDGKNDCVLYSYTGGAHCCYKLSIWTSSKATITKIPFLIDGGYLFGLDLSKPGQFDILNLDHDDHPEIFLQISTYNGVKEPIPLKWKELYNIDEHNIYIDYKDGIFMFKPTKTEKTDRD